MYRCMKCGYETESQDETNCKNCGEVMTQIEKKDFFKTPITRKEYWIRVIALYVIGTIVGFIVDLIISGVYIGPGFMPSHMFVYVLEFGFIVHAEVLRLHDANKTGALALINLIPAVGGIIILIIAGCLKSNHEANKWIEK